VEQLKIGKLRLLLVCPLVVTPVSAALVTVVDLPCMGTFMTDADFRIG